MGVVDDEGEGGGVEDVPRLPDAPELGSEEVPVPCWAIAVPNISEPAVQQASVRINNTCFIFCLCLFVAVPLDFAMLRKCPSRRDTF